MNLNFTGIIAKIKKYCKKQNEKRRQHLTEMYLTERQPSLPYYYLRQNWKDVLASYRALAK